MKAVVVVVSKIDAHTVAVVAHAPRLGDVFEAIAAP